MPARCLLGCLRPAACLPELREALCQQVPVQAQAGLQRGGGEEPRRALVPGLLAGPRANPIQRTRAAAARCWLRHGRLPGRQTQPAIQLRCRGWSQHALQLQQGRHAGCPAGNVRCERPHHQAQGATAAARPAAATAAAGSSSCQQGHGRLHTGGSSHDCAPPSSNVPWFVPGQSSSQGVCAQVPAATLTASSTPPGSQSALPTASSTGDKSTPPGASAAARAPSSARFCAQAATPLPPASRAAAQAQK